uniref:CRAL-TRIO domain-containing protein n=1 Tax=Stomoxys calcitrans TaxID=35570 RepID=A0A1I8PW14_STOCA
MANIRPLPDDLQKVAIKDLNEEPSRIPEDLQALRTWIQQQPYLRARIDDQFLIQFLRGSKYSLEKAKQKIDLFYSLKTKYPEMFGATDVNEPKFKEIHSLGCYTLLPVPLHETGARICVYQFNYCIDKFSNEDIYYPACSMFELAMLNDPYVGINGFVFIYDLAKGTTRHLLEITPTVLKKVVSFMEKSMPVRIKSIYIINAPPAAQAILKIAISLVSEKLRKRLHILSNGIKELAQYVPLKYLPRDYGGENGSFNDSIQEYTKLFELHCDYFKENALYGTDESLRPGKPLDLEGLFGVGGSFRKLVVD